MREELPNPGRPTAGAALLAKIGLALAATAEAARSVAAPTQAHWFVYLLALAFLLFAAVTFLVWQYRSMSTVCAFTGWYPKNSPGKSLGWWAAWLVSNVLSNLSFRISISDAPELTHCARSRRARGADHQPSERQAAFGSRAAQRSITVHAARSPETLSTVRKRSRI